MSLLLKPHATEGDEKKTLLRWTERCSRGVLVVFALVTISAHAYTTSQFQSVTTDQETEINRVRDQEISQIKVVLGRRMPESRRPDILLRLAELYIEKYRFYFLKENEIHQKLYAQGKRPKRVEHEMSQNYLKLSTTACQAILKSKVAFSKMDQVYYFLGYNLMEQGKLKEGLRYFELITKKYPQSVYAPEAYRNLAEKAFERRQYKEAVTLYEKAAQFKNVPSYPRTLYKLAWVYFKTRRYNDALRTMKSVIHASETNDKFIGLREEALNDLVTFFSEAGRFDEAKRYFNEVSGGPEIYVKALAKLSRLYASRGDYKLALQVNSSLIQEYGDSKPELILEILGRNVELYRKLRNGKGEEAALEKLVEYFSKVGTRGGDEETQAIYQRTKGYLRSRATQVHKEAQKTSSKKAYSQAAELYGLYLRAFLSNPSNAKEKSEVSEIRFYRADTLLAAGRKAEAIPLLEKTFSEEGEARYRKEAGATLLNFAIKNLSSGQGDQKENENRFLTLADQYEKAFPQDKLVSELRAKRAILDARNSFVRVQELEKSREYEKAAIEYEKLAKNSSGSDFVFKSYNNAAVNYERADKVGEALRIYKFLLSRYPQQSSPKSDLKRIASKYLWQSEFVQSAKLYETLADEKFYSRNEKQSFLTTAFRLYEGIGDHAAALRVGHKLLKDDPGFAFDLVNVYQDAGKQQDALHLLRAYLKNKKGARKKAEASFLIAQIFEKNGDVSKARSYYEEASRNSSKKPDVASARERNFAAKAAFLLNEVHFSRFQSLKLELPEKKLQATTRKKLSDLESLVTRYQSVVNYGDGEWGIAALERLSDAFHLFAEELLAAPIPPQLNAEQQQVYKREIAKVAGTMEDRSLEFLRKGFQKGIQLEVTTPTFVGLTQRLFLRAPREFPLAHYAAVNPKTKQSHLKLLGPTYEDVSEWRKNIAQKLSDNPKNSENWVSFANLQAITGNPSARKLAHLLYDQALTLSARNPEATNNLALLRFLEGKALESTQGFARALDLAEFNPEIRLNFAKVLLHYHHYNTALKILKPLAAKKPDDVDIQECIAVALLGTGQLSQAETILEKLDGKSSQRFGVWYNWGVWKVVSSNKDDRESALDFLKGNREDVQPLERGHIDMVLQAGAKLDKR